MAKVWKIIGIVFGIAVLLGALCILVGLITGGDLNRIGDLLKQSYDIEQLWLGVEQLIRDILGISPLV